MKAILFLIPIGLVLLACGKDKEPAAPTSAELAGEWVLTERLIDPGNGSGTFQAVSDTKIILFNAQGDYACSGSTCTVGASNIPSHGTYDADSFDIFPSDCTANHGYIKYTLEADTLIISYTCLEACAEKFIKSE